MKRIVDKLGDILNTEKYVTGNKYFGWHEFIVSKDHPELCKKFFLTDYDKKNITLGVQMILDPWRIENPENSIFISSGSNSNAGG